MDSRQPKTISVKRVAPSKAGKVTKTHEVKTPETSNELEFDNTPEPVKTEPKNTPEPVKTEPQSPSEPVKAEPQNTPEPVKTEPQSPSEPVKAEPKSTPEPVKAEPKSTPEPVKAEPKKETINMSNKTYNTQSQSSSSKWIIIVLIVAAIALAYLLFGGESKVESQPAAVEQIKAQPQQEQKSESAPVQEETKKETPKKSQPAPEKKPEPAPVKKSDVNYDAGIKAYETGNGLEAIKKFKASGSADSYYMLGVIYESGCGTVGKNAMMARQNFKKAADMGHAEAKAKLQ
ncbi:MAG: hypothetical protein IJY64_08325 [Bacteroidaceae bacterium]|nr:hypothetical protein [Bacteroidaceae bacterium]